MLDSLQHVITEISPQLHQYGLFILALTIVVEGFGIPAPGQTFLIVSAILASRGEMSLPGILATAALATFIGNCIGYLIGLKFGDILLQKGWIKPSIEQKLQSFIKRYGVAALLVSRFVEGLKQTIGIGCGIAKMPLGAFLLGNALASLVWVLLFGLGPILLVDEMTPMLSFYHHHRLLMWGIGTALILVGVVLLLRWQKRKT